MATGRGESRLRIRCRIWSATAGLCGRLALSSRSGGARRGTSRWNQSSLEKEREDCRCGVPLRPTADRDDIRVRVSRAPPRVVNRATSGIEQERISNYRLRPGCRIFLRAQRRPYSRNRLRISVSSRRYISLHRSSARKPIRGCKRFPFSPRPS